MQVTDLDPMLQWLWCGPAATAVIGLLAWELPYATGAALKNTKKKKNKEIGKERKKFSYLLLEINGIVGASLESVPTAFQVCPFYLMVLSWVVIKTSFIILGLFRS